MNILSILSINIFSFFILLSAFINENTQKLKKMFHDKIFDSLLLTSMIIIILDSAGWIIDGKTFSYGMIVYYAVVIINLIINPCILVEWTMYVSYQLYNVENRARNTGLYALFFITINTVLVLLSPWFGTIFYIDSNNVYHRGNFYICTCLISYLLLFYNFLEVIKNKARIYKNQFISLIIFPVPMVLCNLLQYAFYGISVIWAGCTLSMIIVYIGIQNKRLNTDYLTGLYNRRQLDNYLNEKIKNNSRNSLFAAVMIDIDDFKMINDKFGHNVGDHALEYVAEIMQNSFTKDDLICRYAGDEFVVAFDIMKPEELVERIHILEETLLYFNSKCTKPYKISLSIGYDIYNYNSRMDSEQFIKHIDENMYEKKKIKKSNTDKIIMDKIIID